ncbi:MAG: hypothetical protein KDK33_13905 [Leptospiraceae bacterium]|nr:hypothetical protein [Leptospiraceae bacterium]
MLSYCKINLGLTVGPRRSDSLHRIYSVFLPIGIGDEVIIERSSKFSFYSENQISGSVAFRAFEDVSERGANLEKNLMVRAYRSIEAYLPQGQALSLQIKKRIPPGTGIGSGSSNAACVLRYARNQHWLTTEVAHELAKSLGADVPFFLGGWPALVRGIGDEIEPISVGPVHGLVCFPGLFVSTGEAYTRLKRPLQQSVDAKFGSLLSDSDWQAIASGDWSRLAHWGNDFEGPVFEMFPELAKIKDAFVDSGAVYSSLSGSGSALYGLYSSNQMAIGALGSLQSRYPELQFETFALWEQ